jgi:thioredoxin-related protein
MFDHERSLVTKMSGKPFALIGVNAGDELETVRQAVQEKELNWRSFFDGDSREIVGQFHIEGFPTVFLLDHTGKIRHKFVGVDPAVLDRAIDELVSQVN